MFVRSNKDSFESFYNEAYQIAEELNDTIRTVTSFLGNAPSMIPNTDEVEEHEDIDSKGNKYTWTETVERYVDEKRKFRELCGPSNFNKCTPISFASTKIRKIAEALETIYKLIQTFEEDSLQNVSLQELFSTTENVSVELINGVEVVYYELDGEKFTIAELTNAFYTYSGMSMDAMIQGAIQSNGFRSDEINPMKVLEDVNSFVGSATRASAFGVASKEDILHTADDLGVSVQQSSVESIFTNHPNEEVNSYFTTNAAVAGFALLGAYSLTGGLSLENENNKKPTSSVESNLGQSQMVGTNTTSKNPLPAEPVVNPIPQEPLPPIVELSSEEIPEIVLFDDEIDYDEMAIEKFESLDFEEVTERTNQVVEEALTLFEKEDKSALQEKLKGFGYSEPEIKEIIDNREYVVTSFIEGDRRQQLGEIANRLADQDGIHNFDTSYDDGQEYNDLISGTSSEFIINMGSDPIVTKARTEYWTARDNYQAKLQEANESIADAIEAQDELTSIQKELGSNQSIWTVEQAERYNAVVSEYNDAVRESNEKVALVKDAKETYKSCKNTYMVSKEDYLKKVRRETIHDDKTIQDKVSGSETMEAGTTPVFDKIEFSDEDVLQSISVDNEKKRRFFE